VVFEQAEKNEGKCTGGGHIQVMCDGGRIYQEGAWGNGNKRALAASEVAGTEAEGEEWVPKKNHPSKAWCLAVLIQGLGKNLEKTGEQ